MQKTQNIESPQPKTFSENQPNFKNAALKSVYGRLLITGINLFTR